jgi:hypothetical protein
MLEPVTNIKDSWRSAGFIRTLPRGRQNKWPRLVSKTQKHDELALSDDSATNPRRIADRVWSSSHTSARPSQN